MASQFRKSPWADRRDESRDGSYADFCAWESWIAERLDAMDDAQTRPNSRIVSI